MRIPSELPSRLGACGVASIALSMVSSSWSKNEIKNVSFGGEVRKNNDKWEEKSEGSRLFWRRTLGFCMGNQREGRKPTFHHHTAPRRHTHLNCRVERRTPADGGACSDNLVRFYVFSTDRNLFVSVSFLSASHFEAVVYSNEQ